MNAPPVIVLSEMRTGSSLFCACLELLLRREVVHVPWVRDTIEPDQAAAIRDFLDAGKIVKEHGALPAEIWRTVQPRDYLLIGIVRNPRDQLVSIALWNHGRWISDQDLITAELETMWEQFHRWTAIRSLVRMTEARDYYWTAYEWLLEDPLGELFRLALRLFGRGAGERLRAAWPAIEKRLTQIPKGDGDTQGFRRGGSNDWINWFTPRLLKLTADAQETYWRRLVEARAQRADLPTGAGLVAR